MRLAVVLVLFGLALPASALAEPPRTGFETGNGAAWTTHEQELAFLAQVASQSPRAKIDVIGKTKQGRPLHLVQIGSPMPRGRDAALREPTVLVTCSQHGDEPSGREACLGLLRDLAFSTDPEVISLVATTTWLFVPSANPDGRAADTRENADAVDINRDHLTLTVSESRAVAAVVRDWQPDVALDLHEYGPGMPVIYDDSVLWLWPRNLNTDPAVHDLAVELGRKYLVPAANAAGYGTDEYGQYEVADNDIQQTAGDGDEGIMRNAMGLRHTLGILVETRVDADVRQSALEAADVAQLQRRRVASHRAVLDGLRKFMAERGREVASVTAASMARKAAEGSARNAPVFFGGADNAEPTAAQTLTPAPCGYRLSESALVKAKTALELHGIALTDGPFVSLAQPAEPLIPLLLDKRGSRHLVEADAVGDGCPAPTAAKAPVTSRPAKVTSCVKPRDVLLRLSKPKGRLVRTTVRLGTKRLTVLRRDGQRLVRVPLRGRAGKTVKVRVFEVVRRGGKQRLVRTTRTYRVCSPR